jgi:hypothetical protein
MARMGFKTDSGDVSVAKLVCEEMDQRSDSDRGLPGGGPESPLTTGIHTVFANAVNMLTKNQMYGLLRADISNYCPKYIDAFYADVGRQNISLP